MGRGQWGGGQRVHRGLSPHLGASRSADLMTEMTDLSSDLETSGIPFLDYRTYTERVFFPGHGGCPLQPMFEGPGEEGHRAPVRQGLTQLSNLLNSKLFLLTVRATQAGRGSQGREGKEVGTGHRLGWVVGIGTKVGGPMGMVLPRVSPSCPFYHLAHPYAGGAAQFLPAGPLPRGFTAVPGTAQQA